MAELIDITDKIIPEIEYQYFNDAEFFELYETCLYLMEEFIKECPTFVSEPDFEDIFDENIKELMYSQFEFDIFYTEDAEEEMNDIIEYAKDEFFKNYMPPRSYSNTIILEDPHNNYITQQINVLRNKPQPTQRTKEWYEFRHNLITASNAYKAFENQKVKNQLIYEKCKPLNPALYTEEIKEVVMVILTLHFIGDKNMNHFQLKFMNICTIQQLKILDVFNTKLIYLLEHLLMELMLTHIQNVMDEC
jgi:hypothetical protein